MSSEETEYTLIFIPVRLNGAIIYFIYSFAHQQIANMQLQSH